MYTIFLKLANSFAKCKNSSYVSDSAKHAVMESHHTHFRSRIQSLFKKGCNLLIFFFFLIKLSLIPLRGKDLSPFPIYIFFLSIFPFCNANFLLMCVQLVCGHAVFDAPACIMISFSTNTPSI